MVSTYKRTTTTTNAGMITKLLLRRRTTPRSRRCGTVTRSTYCIITPVRLASTNDACSCSVPVCSSVAVNLFVEGSRGLSFALYDRTRSRTEQYIHARSSKIGYRYSSVDRFLPYVATSSPHPSVQYTTVQYKKNFQVSLSEVLHY